jgi:beta-1,4-N-acetylglucosaminyltransferase
MIFVTVGNATQGFNRLLKAVDGLAGEGFFEGKNVLIQSGNNLEFKATHCEQEDFISPERYAQLINKANLVICHGGAGSLYHVFEAGKIPVVMPRRRKYGEHVDDQFELVKAIAAEGRVIPAYEPEDLPAAIEEARRRNTQPVPPPPSRMLELVAQAIEELLSKKK